MCDIWCTRNVPRWCKFTGNPPICCTLKCKYCFRILSFNIDFSWASSVQLQCCAIVKLHYKRHLVIWDNNAERRASWWQSIAVTWVRRRAGTERGREDQRRLTTEILFITQHMYTLFDNTHAWSNVYISRHTHKHKKKNKNHTLTFALSLSSNNLISLSDRATDGLLTHVPLILTSARLPLSLL